ncbi:hypothetical protein ASNER_054 [Candidatus Uzinura diaspidicola str. ASNER]|uniref:DUF3127 domain-containing protein n=1 Tax=Candidatus Uzinura diaspidicola str. ASNER TaxID=1133592 RepID=L7VK33_9FLAO|nr:hypothetical protein ASNER_054 [Candidatus Uzinura diaspidicola str. ASNER]
MKISGKIKKILDTQTFSSGFRKRELVILTDDLYPQHLLIEFLQEKIYLLNGLKINDYIKISINIRGREWINSEGIRKYFNYIQGWQIEKIKSKVPISSMPTYSSNVIYDDLPF